MCGLAIAVDTDAADTTLTGAQENYIQNEMDLRSLTDGKLRTTYQKGGEQPEQPYIRIVPTTELDDLTRGTHGELLLNEERPHEISYSRIELNPAAEAFDRGTIATEFAQTIGARRDLSNGGDESGLVGTDHAPDPAYSEFAHDMFRIAYNFPLGTNFNQPF